MLFVSSLTSASQSFTRRVQLPGRHTTSTSTIADSIAVKVAILHLFPTLGEITSNIALINSYVAQAFQNGAQIVVAPELATTGYCITPQQVNDSLGMRAPFTQLSVLRNLAIQYNGYVTVGIAEIGVDNNLYNSAIMFKPDGTYFLQRKRGIAFWNARGNLPFDVVPTPYGEIGIAICSDTYLMDWMRIMTLKGADLILTPANWWGDSGQLNTWTTRAYENGINMVIANRWGTEVDRRFPPTPYTYNMNDAPSAVILPAPDYTIAPANQVALVYRSQESPNPKNTILYQTINIPKSRIGNQNNTWMVAARQPAAYTGIGNNYYRPDQGNQPAPGLPPAGDVRVGIMAYWPDTNPQHNLQTIYSQWSASSQNADVVVLPSYGISIGPVDFTKPQWYLSSPWTDIQLFIEQNKIQLLTTSVFGNYDPSKPNTETSVILQPQQVPKAIPAIHSWGMASASPAPPLYIDVDSARIGLLLDHDVLFPETTLDLAKWGADIIILPFDFGSTSYTPSNLVADNWPYNLFKTYSNVVSHIACSNDYGFGMIVENGGGYIQQVVVSDADAGAGFQIIALNSKSVRTKFLNAYYDFDLQTLLGETYEAAKLESSQKVETITHQSSSRKKIKKSIVKSTADPAAHKLVLPPGHINRKK